MHIQIVDLTVEGLSQDEFAKVAGELAPAYSNIPGLISKVWLTDPETNACCGGVYTWENRAAMEAFAETELFKAAMSHPNLNVISASDYGVMEAPTRVTHGLAEARV